MQFSSSLLIVSALLALSLLNGGAVQAEVVPGCGDGVINESPVLNAQPKLLGQVENGTKYLLKNDTTYVYVASLQGTPYDMGYALGRLFGPELAEQAENFGKYMSQELQNTLVEKLKVPKIIVRLFGPGINFIARGLLNLNWYVSQPYTPPRFAEEMRGISDSSGVPYEVIVQLNMVPELTRAHCTIVGAWGPSTPNDSLLQLRALDWDSDAPINKYPLITIYHSTQGGYPFANIGYLGLVGSITAFSSKQIALSEKVWIPKPKNDSIEYTYIGKPWTFVLRDIAQFATNLPDAINMLYNTKRTAMLMLGVGSGASRSFEGVEYSANYLIPFTDKNYTYYSPEHPQLDGVFFWDKKTQPSTNPCLGNILSEQWGNITPATLYRNVTGLGKTGNAQICVFDIYKEQIYLSYSQYNTDINAYTRPLLFIDLKPYWATD